MSMKNSDTIGNRFHDLTVCSAVPQPLRHSVPHQNYSSVVIYIQIYEDMFRVRERTKVQQFCRPEGNKRWKSEMWLSNSADRGVKGGAGKEAQ
jgi:hypothetical protein